MSKVLKFPVTDHIRAHLGFSNVPFGEHVSVLEDAYKKWEGMVRDQYRQLCQAEQHALTVLFCLTHPDHKQKHFEVNHPVASRKQKLVGVLNREDVATIGKWLFAIAVLVLLAAISAHAQKGTSRIDVITVQHSDNSAVKTFAAPFTVKEGANTTFSIGTCPGTDCGKLFVASAAGAGGTPCTTTASSVQYNNAGGFGCISTMTTDGTIVTAKVGADWLFVDPTGPTKKFSFDASNITAGQTRTVNIPDASSTTAQAIAAVAHKAITTMSAQGVFTLAQFACGDLSDAGAFCNGTAYSSLTGVPSTFAPTAHNLLSASHGDTTAASAVRGDGIFAIGASPTWQHLAHSSATGGYFKWNGTDIVASTLAASGTGSPTACTNQAVTAFTLNADAAPTSTCTTITSAFTSGTFSATAHNLLSATHGDTVTHSVVLGDVLFGNSTPAWAALAGQTTSTKEYLSQTGTGTVSAAPAWAQVAYADLSGTPQLPVTKAAVASNWLNSYTSTTGLFTATQPAFTDLSGSAACSQEPALTGDATSSAGSCATTVAKVNGIAYSATAAAHTVEVITTANTTATAKVIPDCTDATGNHLNYTQSTDSFSCGTTDSHVGTVTSVSGTANEITSSGGATPTLSIASTFDIHGKTSTAPVKAGTIVAAPATCQASIELYVETDATAGQQLFICNATGNGWVLVGDGGGAGGGVTSVATTSPITGGTITTTGTIACATCVTSAASLTSNALVVGGGSQASAVLASLGTTTTVLHGNAAGLPTFAAVTSADTTGTFASTPHALLDASVDSDTTNTAPTTGLVPYASATPKWTALAASTLSGGGGFFWESQSTLSAPSSPVLTLANTGGAITNTVLAAPTVAPTLIASNTGGAFTNASATTVFVKYTFNTASGGETTPSSETSIALNTNGCIASSTTCSVTVYIPQLPFNVVGYTVYSSITTNTEKQQTASAACVNITGTCVIGTIGAGAVVPATNTGASITIYVMNTLVNAFGETVGSTEASIAVNSTNGCVAASTTCALTVTAPTLNGNATGYTVYDAIVQSQETQQTASAACVNISANCVIGTLAPTVGPSPPAVNTASNGTAVIPSWKGTSGSGNVILASNASISPGFITGACYADQQPPADMGAKINACYADLPATGGEIYVAPGNYSYTVPIVFGANLKYSTLVCDPSGGTTLTYTPSVGTALTFNAGNAGLPDGQGIRDCKIITTTSPTSAIGMLVGGANGAAGWYGLNYQIQGFSPNLQFGNKVQSFTSEHCVINEGTQGFLYPSGLSLTGEQINFNDCMFASSNDWATDYIKIAPSAGNNAVVTFNDVNVDGAQIHVTAGDVDFVNLHMENTTNPTAPTITSQLTGGTLTSAQTIFVKYTFNIRGGSETQPSAEASLVLNTGSCSSGSACTATITAPTLPPNASGYTVYSSTTTGTEKQQTASAFCVNITANCIIGTAGTGASPSLLYYVQADGGNISFDNMNIISQQAAIPAGFVNAASGANIKASGINFQNTGASIIGFNLQNGSTGDLFALKNLSGSFTYLNQGATALLARHDHNALAQGTFNILSNTATATSGITGTWWGCLNPGVAWLCQMDTSGDFGIAGAMHVGGSTTSLASLNIASGTAPTTPAAGDIWIDTTEEKHVVATSTAGAVKLYDSGGANAVTITPNGSVTAYTLSVPAAAPSQNHMGMDCTTAGACVFSANSQTVGLTSAYTNATTSATNVTGLSFSVDASKTYQGYCELIHQVSANTAGLRITFTAPASPTAIMFEARTFTTATTDRADVGTVAGTLTTGAATTLITTNLPARVGFRLRNGVNAGTLQLQAASFGTGTLTIQPDSFCVMQ